MGMADAAGGTDELKWASFTYLKVCIHIRMHIRTHTHTHTHTVIILFSIISLTIRTIIHIIIFTSHISSLNIKN